MAVYTTGASTYKWDTADSEPHEYFLAWTFADDGVEMISKVWRKLRAKGKFTNATMSVFAVQPDTAIDVNDLTTGANALINISLSDSTEIMQYAVNKIRCRNMLMATVRIGGISTFDGTGQIDTFEEIAVLGDVAGQER